MHCGPGIPRLLKASRAGRLSALQITLCVCAVPLYPLPHRVSWSPYVQRTAAAIISSTMTPAGTRIPELGAWSVGNSSGLMACIVLRIYRSPSSPCHGGGIKIDLTCPWNDLQRVRTDRFDSIRLLIGSGVNRYAGSGTSNLDNSGNIVEQLHYLRLENSPTLRMINDPRMGSCDDIASFDFLRDPQIYLRSPRHLSIVFFFPPPPPFSDLSSPFVDGTFRSIPRLRPRSSEPRSMLLPECDRSTHHQIPTFPHPFVWHT